jgi:hypothetical protein
MAPIFGYFASDEQTGSISSPVGLVTTNALVVIDGPTPGLSASWK